MATLDSIRDYYKPIQPTIKAEDEDILYEEIMPDTNLENFIYCFWQLKTVKPMKTPFDYRVVSDGCIDIFFNHHQPDENFIMGFYRKYTTFSIGTEFDYVGIRFLPAAFPLLFNINAHSLSNKSQHLMTVLPEFSKWIASELHAQLPLKKMIVKLDFKLSQLNAHKALNIDKRFFDALNQIFQCKGNLDTETDLKTGLSPRQLRRKFNQYIGTTPKAFSNVVRFQHILNAKPSNQCLKENKLYFDVGFFDQAHFIKNFKTFYGVTPSEAFR